jgi:hypothetical protein
MYCQICNNKGKPLLFDNKDDYQSHIKKHAISTRYITENKRNKTEELNTIIEAPQIEAQQISSVDNKINGNNNVLGNNNSNNNNNTNNKINNSKNGNSEVTNININIQGKGNEDLGHLTDSNYIRYINSGINMVPRFIEDVHFNPQKPGNHNLYINNFQDDNIEVYNGQKWGPENKNEVIKFIVELQEYRMENWTIDNKEKYPEAYKTYQQFEYLRGDRAKEIKDRVKMLCYTNKDLVKNTRKLHEAYKNKKINN